MLPNVKKIDFNCENKKIITSVDLKRFGTHAIYLTDKLKVDKASSRSIFRLWNGKK